MNAGPGFYGPDNKVADELPSEKQNGRREATLRACHCSPEGQAESRQIDSFNSLEARKATFLLALI